MTYEQAFELGRTFEEFLEHAVTNGDMWHGVAKRATLVPGAAATVAALHGSWKLLVIADDWCGDAVNILPVVARLADATPNLDMRIVSRDEHLHLMDRHLTNGSRSIPVVILLDATGLPRGWWGPRPAELQDWFEREGRPLPKEVRYRKLRRWYARDRGATIAREISELIRCGVVETGPRWGGTLPCDDRHAA